MKSLFKRKDRNKNYSSIPDLNLIGNMDNNISNNSNGGPRVYKNILETIGNTPLVKLNKVPKDHGLECDFYVKCEFMNPGGSIKDRIALSMVKDAASSGRAKPGTRFVEPTSGNTGIGLALVSTIYDYDCTIVTTDKSSDDKIYTTQDLGAEVIQAPASAPYGDPKNFMSVAKKIVEEDPHAMCLNQFSNEVNAQTHYEHTSEEILRSLKHINMVVMGAGTGGTLTGVGRRFKEVLPGCIIVAVDPIGSIMFEGSEPKPYLVEGIGGDFIPRVLDKSVVDRVVQPTDAESINMARELIKKEGLLCGGSSGAAMASAIKAAKEASLGPGKKVVVILPDGIRNYMNKFVCDQWMEAYLLKEVPERDYRWWNRSIWNLDVNTNVPRIPELMSCMDALNAMGDHNDVGLVVNEDGFLKGVVSKNGLRYGATNPKRKGEAIDFRDPVHKYSDKTYYKIIENSGSPTVGLASRILDITPQVVVVEGLRYDKVVLGYIPKGIITPKAVLNFVIKHQKNI